MLSMKLTMAAIGALLAIGGAGGAVWWKLQTAAPPAREPMSVTAIPRSQPIESGQRRMEPGQAKVKDERLRDLALRVDTLESKLAKLNEQQSSISRELQRVTSLANATRFGEPDPGELAFGEPIIQEQVDQADWESQKQIDLTERTVANEQVDPAWASMANSALYEAFSREEMEGLDVIATDCRSTMCRVNLHSSLSAEETYARLMMASPWSSQALIIVGADSSQATYYLAREGERLPLFAVE